VRGRFCLLAQDDVAKHSSGLEPVRLLMLSNVGTAPAAHARQRHPEPRPRRGEGGNTYFKYSTRSLSPGDISEFR
jgi:hypothetical protein